MRQGDIERKRQLGMEILKERQVGRQRDRPVGRNWERGRLTRLTV